MPSRVVAGPGAGNAVSCVVVDKGMIVSYLLERLQQLAFAN